MSASSVEKDFEGNGGNVEAAKKIGSKIAERALAKGIEEVVFDRGGHGVGEYVRVRITSCSSATLFGEEIK